MGKNKQVCGTEDGHVRSPPKLAKVGGTLLPIQPVSVPQAPQHADMLGALTGADPGGRNVQDTPPPPPPSSGDPQTS